MSRNTVDVAIELGNELGLPLVLIASRRQVEARALGGGYAHNWSTESFAEYVRSHDSGKYVLLERDHGGPWQGQLSRERDMSLADAMASATLSYKRDIECGFDLLHIDPSKGPSGTLVDLRTFTERTIELLEFCAAAAKECGRAQSPAFEIGTDEGAMGSATPDEIKEMYLRVRSHCERSKIRPPAFVALPTGTSVRGRCNVGILDSTITTRGDIDADGSLARLLRFFSSQGVLVKQHNADYLSDKTLRWLATSPIAAINVAPQLGVVETLCLMATLRGEHRMMALDRFVELAIESHQWERWLPPDAVADNLERAAVSGHYVFSQFKAEAVSLSLGNLELLDLHLRDAVRREVLRLLRLLSIVGLEAPPSEHAPSDGVRSNSGEAPNREFKK
jgi:tagatose-1,6-bisphosphate aldolase non-catalytic subunit AgaZ/GatZ